MLTLAVERLTYGPDALAHTDRRVVLVRHAAPGDRVLAEVTARQRGYLRAEVRRVLHPGPARVLPGCQWFPVCGGCQWQHVAPVAQHESKGAIVAEQLARVAGLDGATVLPVIAPAEAWGYRSRVTLVAEGRRLGFHRLRSHALVEVGDCPIAAPAVSGHLDVARTWVRTLAMRVDRVTVSEVPGGVALVATGPDRPGPRDLAATETLLVRSATVRGAVLRGARVRHVVGDPRRHVPLEPGLALELPADVFTQVHPAAYRLLLDTLRRLGDFSPGERVLDLYCGAGTLSLPLARQGLTVHGVESDDVAVAAAMQNAGRLDLQMTVERARAEAALARLARGSHDVVVLDPPRVGAADAVAGLAALAARRILYVSCDPATLARDVGMLTAHGYRLVRVQPIDLFPQTYHVEAVAELRLT